MSTSSGSEEANHGWPETRSPLVHRYFELGNYIVIPVVHIQDWLAVAICKASAHRHQYGVLDALKCHYSRKSCGARMGPKHIRFINGDPSESEEHVGCGT